MKALAGSAVVDTIITRLFPQIGHGSLIVDMCRNTDEIFSLWLPVVVLLLGISIGILSRSVFTTRSWFLLFLDLVVTFSEYDFGWLHDQERVVDL